MISSAGGRMPYVKGTKPSIKNSLLLISTGCPALDFIIGGGMPVGSMLLIEEDLSNVYASQLFRYFLTEGIVVGNDLLLASDLNSCEKIISNLPAPTEASTSVSQSNAAEEMRIAWRYENLPKVQTAVDAGGKQFGHNFDLATKLSPEALKDANIHQFAVCDATDDRPVSDRFLEKIRTAFASGSHSQTSKEPHLLRIGLENFGSPLWGDSVAMVKLLRQIKFVSQTSVVNCIVTVPSHLLDEFTLNRFRSIADFVIRLESFADTEISTKKKTNPLFSDHHGLLYVDKLPCWNTVDVHVPDAYEFGFKLMRKKFSIEKLHLPPSLSVVSPESKKNATAGCASTTASCSNVDF